MNDPILVKIAWVFGVVIGYGLLRWRLMLATREFQLRAGCEADDWAADSRVAADARRSLTRLADMAYRPFTPWLVLLALTVATVLPPWRPRDSHVSDDAGVAAEVSRVRLKLVFALVTTSPLACVLAAMVVAVGLLLRGSVSAAGRYISAAGDMFFLGAGTGRSHPA